MRTQSNYLLAVFPNDGVPRLDLSQYMIGQYLINRFKLSIDLKSFIH
jgi:hypothetical protein